MKAPQDVQVPNSDVNQAYEVWCAFHGGYGSQAYHGFWRYLNCFKSHGLRSTMWMTKDGKRRLELLLGPHAHTVMAINRARNQK